MVYEPMVIRIKRGMVMVMVMVVPGPCKERHGGRSRLVTAPGKLLCTSLQCNPFCTSMYLHLNVF